ncbi:MAG: hypothetical protein QXT64_06700 [Desulfurococcaceae archaeon]
MICFDRYRREVKYNRFGAVTVEVSLCQDIAVSRIFYRGIAKHSFFRKAVAGVLMCYPYKAGITVNDVVLFKPHTYEVLAIGTVKSMSYGVKVLFILGSVDAICRVIELGLIDVDIVSSTVKIGCLELSGVRRNYCGGKLINIYEHYVKSVKL